MRAVPLPPYALALGVREGEWGEEADRYADMNEEK
jgi:hypothetical protein